MPIDVVAKQEITVGTDTFVDGTAPDGRFAVAFEDDGETGYFYALELAGGQRIVDAMHVYDVAGVRDRDVPSLVEIGWSRDARKAVLLINDHPHAVFDFDARRGWCRSGFPPPPRDGGWSGHAWDDAATALFA